MKKRLFIGIPAPMRAKDILGKFQKKHNLEALKHVPKDNLHITIHFIGELDEKIIPQITEKTKELSQKTRPLFLKFKKLAFAPKNKKPHMVWAVFEPTKEFGKLTRSLARITKIAINNQNGKPLPHITVSRFDDPNITSNLSLNKVKLQKFSIKAKSLHLFESKIAGDKRTYKPLATFSLKRESHAKV